MSLKNYSRIGFGTAKLHHFHSNTERIKLLSKAYEIGIRYFDTAPLYGHGLAERDIGKFLKIINNRSELIIASKFGLLPSKVVEKFPKLLIPYIATRKLVQRISPDYSRIFEPKRDYSVKNLIEQVEISLNRINTDYIDIVYFHEPQIEDLRQLEFLAEVMECLLRQGFVRQFGISSNWITAKWLYEKKPEIASALQVKVPPIESIDSTQWINKHASVTFGHFQSMPMESNYEDWLNKVAKRAVYWNPYGTILFSTKNINHLQGFSSAIDAVDKKI